LKLRTVSWVAVCVLAPLAVLLVRAWVQGERDLDEAAHLSDRNDAPARAARILALGRAARRLGGPAGRAREALAALGRSGELSAWRELRGSLLATRHLLTPAPPLLDEADRAIADRLAQELVPGGAASDPQRAAQRAVEYERLRHSDEPSRGFSLLALTGAALFIGGLAALLLRGRRRSRFAIATLGLVLYLVGLWRA
jgi:hypothetical protein